MFPALNGTRSGALSFTPATAEDAERVLGAIDPATLTNFSFFTKPITLEEERAYLTKMRQSAYDHIYLIDEELGDACDASRLIGSIGLHEYDAVNRSARLGCIIYRKEDRGRGYGGEAIRTMLSEAFTRLGLHKVYVQFFASKGMEEVERWRKKGFHVEGRLREEYRLGDEWKDMIRMSILDREWESVRP